MTAQVKSSLSPWIGRVLLGLLSLAVVGFIVLQLIPVQRDNPPVISEPVWDSPQTHELARRACFDCHSNETTWPWYSYVAPVSWLVTDDVQEGRDAFNFSEWDGEDDDDDIVEEMVEEISEGDMPPANYIMMHQETRLTDAERQQLIEGLQASLGQ